MSGTMRWTKFWWGDWRADPALRMCGYAARGLWMDMLALMNEGEPHGHLVVAGKVVQARQLAAMCGGAVDEVQALLDELAEAGVYSVTAEGVIFSRRMVRDQAASDQARENGRLGGNPDLSNPTRKPPRKLREGNDGGGGTGDKGSGGNSAEGVNPTGTKSASGVNPQAQKTAQGVNPQNDTLGASAPDETSSPPRTRNDDAQNGGGVNPLDGEMGGGGLTPKPGKPPQGVKLEAEAEREAEEERKPPLGPPSRSGAGTRLPDDWTPNALDVEFARGLGLDPTEVGAAFRDYWIAKPGAGAKKRDWSATWRNWCRQERNRKPAHRNGFLALIDAERALPEPHHEDLAQNEFLQFPVNRAH